MLNTKQRISVKTEFLYKAEEYKKIYEVTGDSF